MAEPRQPDESGRQETYEDGPHGHEHAHEHEPAQRPGGTPSVDRDLLERVLQQTLSSESDRDAFGVIVRFAKRNQDRKITEPEVAMALVEEILEARFHRVPLPADCSEWVATSLLSDPDARDRMKQLWSHALNQANAH